MPNQKLTSNDVKGLNVLHKAFLVGQIAFAAIAFFLVYNNFFQANHNKEQLEKPLQLIAVILSVGGFIMGNSIFKKRLTAIRLMKDSAVAKFEMYRGSSILQWALLEGACLFSIISFLLTNDYSFLCLAGALILTFIMLSPSNVKIIYDLQLTEEEATEL